MRFTSSKSLISRSILIDGSADVVELFVCGITVGRTTQQHGVVDANRAEWIAQVVADHGQHVVARLDGLVGFRVEPRVVESDTGSAGQFFGELEVLLVVRTRAAGVKEEAQRTERFPTDLQRHGQHRARIQRAHDAEVLWIIGKRLQIRIVQSRYQVGTSLQQGGSHRV